MSAEISDRPNQDSMAVVSVVVSRAQDGLSSDYDGRLHNLTVQVRTATAAEAAALYKAYLTDLAQRKAVATARIFKETPAHLDINRFEVELIEAQEKKISNNMSASPVVAPAHDSDRVRKILELEEQPPEIAPLFATGEEPEDVRFSLVDIDVAHHDGEDGEAPPQTAFTFGAKGEENKPSPQRPSLAGEVSSVTPSFVGPPAPYNTFTLDVPVAAREGEFIPADESPPEGTSLSLVVSPPPQGVSIEDIDIEHIEMEPTHHGMKDHHAEIEENGTRRWTPQRIAEDEAKLRLALEHLTGQDLKDFLRDVLVPLNKEVLTELAARQQSNASLPPTVLATLNADLLDHADRLRGFVRTAQNTLRNTPSAPTSALDDGGSSPPPPPPSSGEGQGRASSPVMASRSRPTEERWALTEMLGRGNALQEAVTETVDFARSVKNPTSLTDLLTDELLPEQTDVGNELARRREAYGSEFNQAIFAEREFHLLEHAKVMSQLVSSVQEEVTSLETVAAPSHSSAHRPASIPTIAEMLDVRNAIRRGHLEGGTKTELISHALSGVERALARDPSNAFYRDEMKQLLVFQAEDQRRQALENLRTEEIRVAAEKEAAATPPSFRERLTSVFSRARSSLTDSFTRATNALNPFGQMSATVAKFASVAALGIGLRGAVATSPNQIEEGHTQAPVAEVPAESSSTLNELFSATSKKLMRGFSALRAARSPQEESYARKSEEHTHEPG